MYVADFFLRLEWLNSHQQCVFQIYAYEVYINKCVFVLPQRAVRTYHTYIGSEIIGHVVYIVCYSISESTRIGLKSIAA